MKTLDIKGVARVSLNMAQQILDRIEKAMEGFDSTAIVDVAIISTAIAFVGSCKMCNLSEEKMQKILKNVIGAYYGPNNMDPERILN